MIYSLNELNPVQPVVIIAGRELTLGRFSLAVESWAIEKFSDKDKANGAVVLVQKIVDDEFSHVLYALLYRLVDHPVVKSYAEFLELIIKAEKTKLLNPKSEYKYDSSLREIQNALVVCASNAQPIIKNKQRQKELAEINEAKGQSSEACYGVYYDTFAKRYGYTIDEFYNLTLRQVHSMLKVMGGEKYKELEVQAALSGRKLKPRIEELDLSEEDDKEIEDYAKEIKERLARESEELKRTKK